MSYAKIELDYIESINALEAFIKSGEQSPERLADLVTVALDACIAKAKAMKNIRKRVRFDYNTVDDIVRYCGNTIENFTDRHADNPLACAAEVVAGEVILTAMHAVNY